MKSKAFEWTARTIAVSGGNGKHGALGQHKDIDLTV